jgi:hypothetical protein
MPSSLCGVRVVEGGNNALKKIAGDDFSVSKHYI